MGRQGRGCVALRTGALGQVNAANDNAGCSQQCTKRKRAVALWAMKR